ncbi:ubiquitin carboxyl-terminal hydrolase 32, partial [Asbolus verrucosus]
LFLALDVNRDGHVDFKELCCGISAACRGPTAERMKFCFKIFDMDKDCYLNSKELHHMIHTLLFIANEDDRKKDGDSFEVSFVDDSKILDSLTKRLDKDGGLSQEEFLVWGVEDNGMLEPMLELLFQVCHVSFVLRPHCRHHEHDIVTGWLQREERRGYHVGQFWYLISSDWWQNWLNYATAPRSNLDHCNCRSDSRMAVEEGIVCDESLISNGTDCTSNSNEFNSNSMESMGDLLSKGDSCSIASSSGVSSSSGTTALKRSTPGPIENSSLVAEPPHKVRTLTGEGGRLKRDTPLVQHRDFELVPDLLWKALAHWYGGPLPLPRQVILPPGSYEVELELYPLNLSIWMHQAAGAPSASWSSVVGGYGAAALSTAGITATPMVSPRKHLAHTAAFSRLANVRQVIEFLCSRLSLRMEDVRLWHVKDTTILLEDENATLQDLGILDGDKILLEVRNKDLTWPEELGALVAGGQGANASIGTERRPTICLPPGATGLHNLGNTCFMNAALQAVSNTRPLTMYFQRDGQLCELNSMNPLGTKGMVARRYAELCRELWAGSTRSVAPLKLRYCVTKHAPHLGGGGQHDSQELLAWLLDALHEDLNRVARKQYTELKDSGGRPDEIVAEEAWVQHLARDHSIITDLFYGQLKSKVTCQTCGHESVRFDPFNLLSLPLPMESYILCEILVVRLNGETPIKYGLRLNSEAKYFELKQQLYHLCNIKTDRLLLAEIAYSQIRQILNDDSRINPGTAIELHAYEIPGNTAKAHQESDDLDNDMDVDVGVSDSPLARSPEVRGGSALCMPNILCFKNKPKIDDQVTNGVVFKKASIIHTSIDNSSDCSCKFPNYLVAVHRKCVRQETYFLSQQKSKPSLFGSPLLLGCSPSSTCQSLYEAVWGQVTRLLSPLPQSDQNNHAMDCDDSLGYEFPFTLKAVLQGGQICAICHWTQFCRGCTLPCSEELLIDHCRGNLNVMCIAIDWDPTALHLRYQSNREKLWVEDESVGKCRKLHTEPIDLDYCLKAFTSEERLEAKYHCSNCQDKQPATKKLQIWRLPPILIIHLKRFDYVNNKWVKTQKVVNFPFKDFDPTAYLASVPQETILRHLQLQDLESSCGHQSSVKIIEENGEVGALQGSNEHSKLLNEDNRNNKPKRQLNKVRARLESTSLLKTPIIDEHLKDYHQHKLLPGQDRFDLKYQLYAVVSHSGMLNGGHYISYACNPNGNWYCYNDSSCREVLTETAENATRSKRNGCTSLSKRKIMKGDENSNSSDTAIHSSSPSLVSDDDDDDNEEEHNESDLNPVNSHKCAYSDVKIPKIDTSSAYILFYERSGLDYKPYLPDVVSNGQIVPEVELDENESE